MRLARSTGMCRQSGPRSSPGPRTRPPGTAEDVSIQRLLDQQAVARRSNGCRGVVESLGDPRGRAWPGGAAVAHGRAGVWGDESRMIVRDAGALLGPTRREGSRRRRIRSPQKGVRAVLPRALSLEPLEWMRKKWLSSPSWHKACGWTIREATRRRLRTLGEYEETAGVALCGAEKNHFCGRVI